MSHCCDLLNILFIAKMVCCTSICEVKHAYNILLMMLNVNATCYMVLVKYQVWCCTHNTSLFSNYQFTPVSISQIVRFLLLFVFIISLVRHHHPALLHHQAIPSVTRAALWQNQTMHCGYFDTTQKGNHSSYLTPTVVGGGRRPLSSEICT